MGHPVLKLYQAKIRLLFALRSIPVQIKGKPEFLPTKVVIIFLQFVENPLFHLRKDVLLLNYITSTIFFSFLDQTKERNEMSHFAREANWAVVTIFIFWAAITTL